MPPSRGCHKEVGRLQTQPTWWTRRRPLSPVDCSVSKEHTRRHVAVLRGRFTLLLRLQDQLLLLPPWLLPGSHLRLLDQPLLYQELHAMPASSPRLREHLSSFFSQPEKPPSVLYRTYHKGPSTSEDTYNVGLHLRRLVNQNMSRAIGVLYP